MNYPSDSKPELDKMKKIKEILEQSHIPDTYKLDMIRKVVMG